MVGIIGILALQGNYQQHQNILKCLGVRTKYVRYATDLDNCSALIIPGGESTTMSIQINRNKLRNPLIEFAEQKSIFGTCAGMIMLSSNNATNNLDPLKIMKYSVKRNSWGRQINSFSDNLTLSFDTDNDFNGVFIRAPEVSKLSDSITVLAKYNNNPVMLTDGKHFACSFHPEIGFDRRIHSYILDNINV